MAKKRSAEEVDPNVWMNTYSDMVTLLMCFFVLLYASSTPDETKWQYIFQSFTNSGTYVNPFVMDEDTSLSNNPDDDGNSMEPPDGTDGEEDNIVNNTNLPQSFNELLNWANGVAASSDFADSIDVQMNASGSITITFDSSVLFEPDSAELLSSGREALSMFLPGIKALSDFIARIDVSGHTAVALSSVNDWDLSAARACSVIKYMDYRRVVDSDVYLAQGYAQYSPIADNDTEEGRAKNRRVEITIVRNNNEEVNNDVIEDILKYDYGIGNGGVAQTSPDNASAVEQIISKLEDKYQTDINEDGTVAGSESGPTITPSVTGVPDSAIHEIDEEGNIVTDSSEAASAPDESEADVSAEEE